MKASVSLKTRRTRPTPRLTRLVLVQIAVAALVAFGMATPTAAASRHVARTAAASPTPVSSSPAMLVPPLGDLFNAASAGERLNFSPSQYNAVSVCPPNSCDALELVPKDLTKADLHANAAVEANRLEDGSDTVTNPYPLAGGYTPQDLEAAYDLPATTPAGATQTIAIIAAYDDPNAEADLSVYSTAMGLPQCTTANGCFRKVDQNGGTSYPLPNGGTAGETSLDLDMAHAICQNCHILLVEAEDIDEYNQVDFDGAVGEAEGLGATVISISYGWAETMFSSDYTTTDYNYPGTVIVASAGDEGFEQWGLLKSDPADTNAPEFPAADPDVVAVGGTTLIATDLTDPLLNTWTSQVWDGTTYDEENTGTGGGCSKHWTAQAWQSSVSDWAQQGCGTMREVSDVSADADPYTGVDVYDSYPDGQGGPTGWQVDGGTSASTPIVAGEFALAGGAHGVAYPAQTLYQNLGNTNDLIDVTQGTNDPYKYYCSVTTLLACNAAPGYDGPTGVGSPTGLNAFFPPAAAPTVSITTPANGATYYLNQAVTSDYSCSDGSGGPGIASCLVGLSGGDDLPSGGAVYTTSPGTFTFTVTAVSKDGLTGTATVTYNVSPTQAPPASPPSSTSSSTPPSSTSSSTPTATSTTAMTGTVGLVSSKIPVKGGKAAFGLTCTGTAPSCSGQLVLTSKMKAGTGTKARTRTVTIGAGSFSIPEGSTTFVKLQVSAQGHTAMLRNHSRLNATLTLTKSAPNPTVTQTVPVRCTCK